VNTGGGQFGAGIEDARGDHGYDTIALGATFGGNQVIQAGAFDYANHGLEYGRPSC